MRHAFAIVFAIGLVVACQGQTPTSAAKADSLQPLLEVLQKAGVSGSLEFSGRCDSLDVAAFPDFPQLQAHANSKDTLQTVREMFSADPLMQVTQEPGGTIRMIERGVATDLLDIWIEHISFDSGQPATSHGIYDPNMALTYVLAAPEVQRFMKAYDIEWPYQGGPISILVGTGTPPPSTTPHISGPLDNVTFSHAMDHILKVFPGIWIYETCPQADKRNRIVYFRFYHLQKTSLGVTVQ